MSVNRRNHNRRNHSGGRAILTGQATTRVSQPSTYVHTDRRPSPDDTYLIEGVAHRWDGRCHADCPNVR